MMSEVRAEGIAGRSCELKQPTCGQRLVIDRLHCLLSRWGPPTCRN